MKSFRERNPVPIGLIGTAVIAVFLLVGMNASNIPFLGGGGDTYAAAFSEAAGLKPGEEVRIAGVKVGTVRNVDLEGDHVRIEFRINPGVTFGAQSRAEIKIKTILGQHYLAIVPHGRGKQSPDDEIPLSRTTPPFNVVPAFSKLTRQTEKIDTKQLARAFNTMATTFKDSPPEVRASLRGLSRLSRTVASRDDDLRELVRHTSRVSGVLADHTREFTKLIDDGGKLLREIRKRRAVIHNLLVNTVIFANEVNGLIKDNRAQLKPALDHLNSVIRVLNKNEGNLDKAMKLLGPFIRQLTDATSSGRWLDGYVQNLLPLPFSIGPGPNSDGSLVPQISSSGKNEDDQDKTLGGILPGGGS